MKLNITCDELMYLCFLQGGTWYYSYNGIVSIGNNKLNEENYKIARESLIKKGYIKQSFSGKKTLSENVKAVVDIYVNCRRIVVFNNIVPGIKNERLLYISCNKGILKIEENNGKCIADIIDQEVLYSEKVIILDYIKKLIVENQESLNFIITKELADSLKKDVNSQKKEDLLNKLKLAEINTNYGRFFVKCLAGKVHNFHI